MPFGGHFNQSNKTCTLSPGMGSCGVVVVGISSIVDPVFPHANARKYWQAWHFVRRLVLLSLDCKSLLYKKDLGKNHAVTMGKTSLTKSKLITANKGLRHSFEQGHTSALSFFLTWRMSQMSS